MTSVLCMLYCVCVCLLQATIGIDFLSKTMYLEDRTVSSFVSDRSVIQRILVSCCVRIILPRMEQISTWNRETFSQSPEAVRAYPVVPNCSFGIWSVDRQTSSDGLEMQLWSGWWFVLLKCYQKFNRFTYGTRSPLLSITRGMLSTESGIYARNTRPGSELGQNK